MRTIRLCMMLWVACSQFGTTSIRAEARDGRILFSKPVAEGAFSALPIVELAKGAEVAKRKLSCSSVLIGQRVVLTAAHCVSDDTVKLKFYRSSVRTEGEKFVSGQCTRHPLFKVNQTADYALCLLSAKIEELKPEWLATNKSLLTTGNALHLIGYGCRTVEARNKPLVGDNIRLAVSTGRLVIVGTLFSTAPYANNYLTLANEAVRSVLCEGDSGGAGVLSLDRQLSPDSSVVEIAARRVVIAVNSGYVAQREGISLIATTLSEDFGRFLASWLNLNGQPQICDFDLRRPADLSVCRELR